MTIYLINQLDRLMLLLFISGISCIIAGTYMMVVSEVDYGHKSKGSVRTLAVGVVLIILFALLPDSSSMREIMYDDSCYTFED